jgi:hypothetical protein
MKGLRVERPYHLPLTMRDRTVLRLPSACRTTELSADSLDFLLTMSQRVVLGILLGGAGALLAQGASAGLFTTALSDADARDLKRIAIVSVLGHRLQGQQIGLTVFGNRHFDADLPDWTLDADVRGLLQEEVAASGRLSGTLELWEDAPGGDRKTLLAAAREKGFDAVLIAQPTDNPNAPMLPAGPALLHRKVMGLDKLHVCDSMNVLIWRVADGKMIGHSVPDPCDYMQSLPAQLWHDNWSEYSDDERRTALEQIEAHVRKQIRIALIDLNLQRR